jgi:hypothetical protein
METELQVTATDLYVSFPLWMDEEQPLLSAESEVALLVGETDRPYLEETLDEGAKILSMGWIGRLHLTPNDWLHLRLEAGYASGDNDGRDDTVSLFSFHSDYAAGMVLFDQVIPMLTARSIDRIHDPDLVETAPASTRYLVNQGAVRDVRYLYPVLTVQPWAWLECKAAYLYAQRASDVADPFQTGIAGGYSTGFDGTTRGSKDLGQEIAASIRITAELIDRWTASAQIEAGLFFPGAALSVLDQEKISALRLGGELSW